MKSEIRTGMTIGAMAIASLGAAHAQQPNDAQYPAPYPARQPSYQQQPPAYQQEPVYQDQNAQQQQQGRYFTAQELDGLVGRIALHPDPLLVQILTAAAYPDQVEAMARGGNSGYSDQAVEGLRQYPQVLQMMTSDMNWTADIGWAFANQRAEVMDAVQRMRRQARDYGYLRSNERMTVGGNGGYIDIEPADSGLMYLPVYDPYVVYAPPRYGYSPFAAISFGPCFRLSAGFGWGWNRFAWGEHRVFVNNRVWERPVYVNNRVTNVYNAPRYGYRDEGRVHPYRTEAPRVETRRMETYRTEARRMETRRMESYRTEAPRTETRRMETPRAEAPRMQAYHTEARPEFSHGDGGRGHGGRGR